MEASDSVSSFGYSCMMKASNEPDLYPQEEVYLRLPNITLSDKV
jgi:hypothetical protein